MLTRDKRLRTAPDVLYIEGHLFRDQIREVMARFPFDTRRWAFTRCSVCNEVLKQVSREAVMRRVNSRNTASPARCPCVSFRLLKLSISSMTTPK